MKKIILLFLFQLVSLISYSQEHFAGLLTSSHVGIMNAEINPAELTNISNTFEVNLFGASINVANNKIGFNDIVSGKKIEDLIFLGNDPVNMRFDALIYGPSFAMKYKKWAFGFTTIANGKLDLVDIDTKIGSAINNSTLLGLFNNTTISNNYNQRINGTTWGEIGLSASRILYETNKHKFSAGVSFKLLFPGAYANFGADKFSGVITTTAGQSNLSNTTANLNIAYSGSLANSFSNIGDYSKSVYGGLNGLAADLGVNYQLKDENNIAATKSEKNYQNHYKLNAGMSIKNIGTMTFRDANNQSTNYTLSIQGAQSLNLNQFSNAESIKDIETTLLNSGFLTKIDASKNFKVNLPTTFNAYADVKLISKLYVSGYLQQKLNNNDQNDQITAQNIVTLTPRFNTGFFEVYVPFSNSDVSGFHTGFGFRIGGFYLGSSSIVTALISDSKQADIYTGFRWAFL